MSPIPRPKMAAPGEGKTIMLFAVRFDYKVTSADSGGDLAALEVTIPPRTLVKPHNLRARTSSRWCWPGPSGPGSGTRWWRPAPGASMVKPRGTPHAMWNLGPEPARVLEVVSPGGLEDYFEELAPALAAKIPPAEYDALAERYGLTIQNDWIEELERTYKVKL